MTLTAFEERKFLKWGDFLMEIAEQNKKDVEIDKKYALSKDEKVYLNLQISRGNEIQEQLDETWLDNGFMPYSTYIRQMNRFIAIQDSIISNIIEYMNELKRYKSKQ